MKRILSLTLALVMILGTFTGVFAAEPTVEEAAAKFLAKEEILLGDDNGDLMLKDNLERRDAVILLSRLLGVEEVAAEFPTSEESPSWTDVRTDAYYVPFFAWAQANGYFEGNEDNTFAPREAISAPEYALVLLRALGYEVNGHESWKASLETAEKIGLLKDVEVEFEDKVVRGQMAVMTLNALGTKMKDSDKTLAEELGIELPEEPKAKELTAEVKDTENLAEVVVELSNVDLVKNANELENAANYRINSEGVKVYSAKLDGDNVILTLVPYGKVDDQEEFKSLVKGREYKLTVRNIDPELNKTFTFVAGDNEIPAVEKVEFIGTHGIKVTTSEPIMNPQERNFRVSDKRTSMIIEQYGRDLILTPYHSGSFDKDATELVVEGLVDFAGYRSVKTYEEMELDTDPAAPVVEAAYRNGNKLTVVFEEDIYMDSVEAKTSRRDLGNVSFVERRVTFYADKAEKVDTNVAVYTFEREIPKDAEVTVEGVQNHSKVTMEKEVVVPGLFVDEYAPVVISDLETTIRRNDEGNAELEIVFDKDIKEFDKAKPEDINLDRHFTLYLLEVSSRGEKEAKYVELEVTEVKQDRITLRFNNIDNNNKNRDFDYVLEVRNFSDFSGNRMEREYIDFQVLPKATTFNVERISIEDVKHFNREAVEIKLEFNGYVDKVSAEEANNYYINGKLLVDDAIVERDGVTVTLVIYDTTKTKLLEKYDELEISPRVKNLSKKATVANRFWDLVVGDAVTAVEELIDNLPEVKDLTVEHINAIEEAETAYKELGRRQKALVDSDLVSKLEDAIEKLVDLKEEVEDEAKAIADAKEKLTKAIADAKLSDEEEANHTPSSVNAAKTIIERAVTEAQAALTDESATVKSLEKAKSDLEAGVILAKSMLDSKNEPEEQKAPEITTVDAKEFSFNFDGALPADTTVKANDKNVTNNKVSFTEEQEALEVVIVIPGTDETLEGTFSFTYAINRDKVNSVWIVELVTE